MGFLSSTDPREKAVNQQIQQTHNQINELYLDLGRYVKLNLKDQINDQYVKNAVQNIDDCLARLQQLNNDLNSIRGIKLCVNCSAQIPVAVTFCPQCGTKQPDNNMNAPMMNGAMGAPMNNMNNTMGGQMNNGGFGGAAPVPTPIPTPAPTPFNPSSAGNSPANANKNKIGADAGTQQPIPSAPVPPTNNVPPVPPAPQADDALKDIPPVPPMPEMTDRKPPEADTLSTNMVTNNAPAAEPTTEAPAAVINEAPEAPKTESFVFCSQCGHKEASGVAFCSQCGSKL